MRGGPYNIKHKEIHSFYHSYEGEKCRYDVFFARVVSGRTYEESIQKRLLSRHIKGHVDKNGRECTKCGIYKIWREFNKSKLGVGGYMNICRECSRKQKLLYRERTNREKDREYREKIRKLKIGQKLAFCKEVYVDGYPREVVREVMKYEFKKGYLLYSPLLKQYTRFSTSHNHNHPQNKLSKRFYLVNDE